jgi:extracellular elastinolytic metalloproteinase
MYIPHTSRKRIFLFLVTMLSLYTVKAQQAQANAAAVQQSPGSPKQKAMELLQKNLKASGLNQSTLNSYVITDAYSDKKTGYFLVYLQQAYLGIPVYNKIGVYVFRNDTLVEKRPDFIGRIAAKAESRSVAGAKAVYSVNAIQAIRNAANHLSIAVQQEPRLIQKDEVRQHFVYSGAGLSNNDIPSDLVWLPVNEGAVVKLSWNVRIVAPNGNEDWLVRVDAQTGEVLEKSSLIVKEKAQEDCGVLPGANILTASDMLAGSNGLTAGDGRSVAKLALASAVALPPAMALPPAVASASYHVYPIPIESANFGSRALDTDPWLRAGAGNNAGTLGWHFDNTTNYTFTRGNNVWAQEDLTGASVFSGLSDTSTTAVPTLTFDRTLDPAAQPATFSNIRAGIDNLFYWNNLMHDISYQYGFDEPAGNFQASNQGRGGQENDYVHAFAEDGAGLNNADFATPPDGSSPRMRMFQFTVDDVAHFHVNSPGAAVNDYTVVESGISLRNQLAIVGAVTADIVQVNDGPGPTTHLACGSINNAPSLVGKIALIDRGTCSFAIKIKNAQLAGAVGVIVVNTVGNPLVVMTGTDLTITIPAVMISNADGVILEANLTGLNGTLSETGVNRDGTLDNGVMAHEYTHGISNRLTGGPANTDCLANAEQMGEGWSDYVALMVTTDWSTAAVTDGPKKRPLGTYVESQPATGGGIRTFPYSTDMSVNPWTYDMLKTSTGGEPHTVGEIWCATIWDMTWNIIQQEGIDPDIYHGTKGNNIALQLVLEGMKLQVCSPGFLDGRDAILKADSLLYNNTHKCAIWNAFARRGMGKSALEGSSNSFTDQTGAFDLPSGVGISQTVDKTTLVQGQNINYTIKATCDCSPLTNISIVDTLSSNLSFVGSSGGTFTAPVVHFDGISFAANETKSFTIQAGVLGTFAAPDTLINDSEDPASFTWAKAATTGSTNFVVSTVRSHSGSHAWLAADPATPADFTLTSGDLVLDTVSILSFWHFFETESTFDGGVVEISTNGGASWQDLGGFMTQNPYNNTLDPEATGLPNRKAFSGSSGGVFIQTIIPITGFAGKTARIRFRFTSDNGNAGIEEGWYIDDIQLTNANGASSIGNAFSGATLLSNSNVVSLFAPVALPVNFLGFDARKLNNTSFLQWRVNGEINVDKYIVQRSGDGVVFAPIGEVPGDPSPSSGEKDYVFTDGQPLQGNDFYRIVERDRDGQLTFSGIKLLSYSSSGMVIHLSPVPTYNHILQLEIETGDDAPVQATLLNTVGQTIRVYAIKQGTNVLDLGSFARGVYFLRIQTSRNNSEVRKVLIQ